MVPHCLNSSLTILNNSFVMNHCLLRNYFRLIPQDGGWPTSRFCMLTLKRRTRLHLGVPHVSRFSKRGTLLEGQIFSNDGRGSHHGWAPHLGPHEIRGTPRDLLLFFEMWATRPDDCQRMRRNPYHPRNGSDLPQQTCQCQGFTLLFILDRVQMWATCPMTNYVRELLGDTGV